MLQQNAPKHSAIHQRYARTWPHSSGEWGWWELRFYGAGGGSVRRLGEIRVYEVYGCVEVEEFSGEIWREGRQVLGVLWEDGGGWEGCWIDGIVSDSRHLLLNSRMLLHRRLPHPLRHHLPPPLRHRLRVQKPHPTLDPGRSLCGAGRLEGWAFHKTHIWGVWNA